MAEGIQALLLQLRELQYITRYGDYLKILPNQVRKHSRCLNHPDSELLAGSPFWSDIANTLMKEKSDYEKLSTTPKASVHDARMPMTHLVDVMAAELGLSPELCQWSIIRYGDRNSKVHANMTTLIANGDFSTLAKFMFADREDLEMTFSLIKNENDIEQLRCIIDGEIARSFDTSVDPRNPSTWLATKALQDEYRAAKQHAKIQEVKAAARQEDKAKKGVGSTEVPRGAESEEVERRARTRAEMLAQVCRLEENIKKILADFDKLDKLA